MESSKETYKVICKDKYGQKLFSCIECKNEFYSKNHKEDPNGKAVINATQT